MENNGKTGKTGIIGKTVKFGKTEMHPKACSCVFWVCYDLHAAQVLCFAKLTNITNITKTTGGGSLTTFFEKHRREE